MPLVMKVVPSYFEGPDEIEPNDTRNTANGPLQSGKTYNGRFNYLDEFGNEKTLPIIDPKTWYDKDYFYINLTINGTVTVSLSNYNSDHLVQVLLYNEGGVSSIGLCHKNKDMNSCSFSVNDKPSGKYYVFVYQTGSNVEVTYNLNVTYP
jgi:hypothetical protein